MHRGHDHDHHHHGGAPARPGPGHNHAPSRARRPVADTPSRRPRARPTTTASPTSIWSRPPSSRPSCRRATRPASSASPACRSRPRPPTAARLVLLRVETDAGHRRRQRHPPSRRRLVPLRPASRQDDGPAPPPPLHLFRRHRPPPADPCRGARALRGLSPRQKVPHGGHVKSFTDRSSTHLYIQLVSTNRSTPRGAFGPVRHLPADAGNAFGVRECLPSIFRARPKSSTPRA